jgi:hypothetical protein
MTRAAAQPVEATTVTITTVGLRNPPCCGRANAPRIKRTRRVGAVRLADAVCSLCGHKLRIHYEKVGDAWQPRLAKDMTRTPQAALASRHSSDKGTL